jgi:DNA repair protein RadA/Sms
MVEETVAPEAPKAAQSMARSGPASQAASLADIAMEDMARMETGIGELDRVLGGGIVPGALILLSGDPGIGKSTLVLQLAAAVCDKNGTVLYGSGEESAGQIKMRAQRLGISTPDLIIQADTSLDHILDEAKKRRPALLVVDSIQTMYSQSVEGTPGSLAQIRREHEPPHDLCQKRRHPHRRHRPRHQGRRHCRAAHDGTHGRRGPLL